jgi:NADH:ubiquinone oxidoreductase subunit F (NADH-binding)/Pyruvate/2-oxoacid:ferredoxin oxidoreductase delta subunit/(2Fe-2S) ferredoxin
MSSMIATDNKEFLVEKVLKNYSGIFEKPVSDKLAQIRREKIIKPVIYVGMGSCGMIAGSMATLAAVKSYLESNSIDATVVETGCIGLCSAEPLVDIQLPGKTRLSYHHVTAAKVEEILSSALLRNPDPDMILGQYKFASHEDWPGIPYLEQLPFFALQRKNILRNAGMISPWSIDDYIARGGYKSLYKTVLNYTADKVCEIIEQSELRGRGGGGFSTGKKWNVALTTGSDNKYLICNADESDPGAFMDRALLETDPNRIVEGMAIAAYGIGANHAYLYVRSNYGHSISLMEHAIKSAKEYGFLGDNIFGSGFNLNISIKQGAGAFVCGEETALIASLEGRRGLPSTKPPFPAEKGLGGHPTVVNNVETLANIPTIMENGPSWFRAIGTRESKGTKLFSISGKSVNTGFIEIPMGIRIADIVNSIAGGVRDGKKLKAVQLGGPSGVCIPPADLDTPIGYETLPAIGATLGLGGLIVLDEDTCMVNLSKYFMAFLQKESCGKCIPCREGTRRMLEILEGITRRPKEESSHETLERFKGVVQLENLAEVIRDTSLCGLGQNASNPVLSSLKWFREEYEEHIFDRKCEAGICHDLRTYFIEVEACTGCNVCQKKCPENAIIGTSKLPHFIVESKCTGCGICFESCKFSAIYYK